MKVFNFDMVDKTMIGHKSHDVILESFHRLLEFLSPNYTFHSIKNHWKNICIQKFEILLGLK